MDYKPAGKAVALARGHYPDESGRSLVIQPGQTFTVWEGLTKSKWFKLVTKGAPAPEAPAKTTVPEPDTLAAAAAAERKRKAAAKPPTADDIV